MKADTLLYLQASQELEMDILSGRLLPGQRFPAIRALAPRFHMNPGTMHKSILELQRAGLVKSKRGYGTFVTTDTAYIAARREKTAVRLTAELWTQLHTLGLSASDIPAFLTGRNAEREGISC